ncbi:Hypothetical predicted protein [Olea europaea subsp. europaea]|uniref:Uncharacterized protein n=1 Tax=Olea europaea subsp. europaea TaxID=158383 RepID=A0A8S0UFJ1_OLEEU|nr:Hypothetical predicted protein [Olea europaea subsp. europaea]
MGRREERFATKGTINSPEVGEVDDGDIGCVCHLRGSLRGDRIVDNVDVVQAQVGANDQPVEQIWETSTSDIPCSVENEEGVEVANDQPTRFAEPSTIGSATLDQSSAFEGASRVDDHGNMQFEGATGLEYPIDTQFEQPTIEGAMGLEDPVDTQFEQPTFEGAMGLEDPIDTKFEQPTSEGATGLQDLGNALVEPFVEEAINAQNTGTRSSDDESEVTTLPSNPFRPTTMDTTVPPQCHHPHHYRIAHRSSP